MSGKCYFCDCVLGTLSDGDIAAANGNHWTGTEYIRVDLCVKCLSLNKLQTAPRRKRQPRTTVIATDWNMLVAFNKKGQR